MMRMNPQEKREFLILSRTLRHSAAVRAMQRYPQHGDTDTYRHCERVALLSFLLCRRLHLHADLASLVRGAYLHDFYLYDWHQRDRSHRLHGFRHPAAALRNADRVFSLNTIERDIIATHMWPLTLTRLPRYRESAVVCFADKCCALLETWRPSAAQETI